MCLNVTYVYRIHAWCPQSSKEGMISQESEFPIYRCWGPNLGPLQEHLLLTAEPFFQPLKWFLLKSLKKLKEDGNNS